MILSAFLRALGQIGDARFGRVLLLGIGLTAALLVAATVGVFWLLQALTGETATLPLLGEVAWLGDLLSWGAVLVMLALSVVLMIPVASAITSMFLETVAAAVEARHYPQLAPAPAIPWPDALRDTLGFLGVLIVANLAALLLYALFAPAALLIFWGLNGFLLGREYFTLAAMRRVGRAQAKELRRKHGGTIWLAGTLMAIPLTVPVLGLVIPILGVATFTHIYHGLAGTRRAGASRAS